jgi:hypothetical protein
LLPKLLPKIGQQRVMTCFFFRFLKHRTDIKSSDWILALSADGVPLGLGQQGPIWLINARAPDFKPARHAHWVWAVFYVKVGE